MKKTIEVEIDGLEYDNGYGGIQATLICDVEVEILPSTVVTTIKDGEWFLIDQDGGSRGSKPYDCGTHDKELLRLALMRCKDE